MAKGKGQINGWITKNGIHIPIYGHYSVRGGEEPKAKGTKFKRKKRPEEFDKDIRETESGKFMAQYSSDQGRKKGVKDIEKPFETREGARKFLAEENGEYEDAKFNKKAEAETYQKSGQLSKDLQASNKALDEKWQEHSKAEEKNRPKNFKEGLKQHEGIQQIAEEQNRKVWNGGASNQELYDAADKFAEEKNFNKEKVRDAAFSAFNEKWVNEKNSRQEKFAEGNRQKAMQEFQEEQQARQSFKDKKAQELGFADDASMRSYNEETGVNKETWKEKGSLKSNLAGVTKIHFQGKTSEWDSEKGEFGDWKEDSKTNKEQESSTPTEPYAKSNNKYLGQSVRDLNKLDVRNLNDSELSQLREHASASSRTGARGADKLWKNADTEINRRAMGQESSTQSFSPESSAKAINDMARRRANGGGKNDDWKTAQSVLESAPAGTTMIQTGNRGVKFQYTKGQDGTWHSSAGSEYDSDSKKLSMSWRGESGPSVEFTTPDKALSNADIKASHNAATSGRLNQALGLDRNNRPIGNRSTRKVDTSTSARTEKQASLSGGMAKRREIRAQISDTNKAKNGNFGDMTVSGLKQALAGARPGDKTKIRAELRKRGYTYIGGKWVKA